MAELIGGWDANRLAKFIDDRIPTQRAPTHQQVNNSSAFVKLSEVVLPAAAAKIDIPGIVPEYSHLLLMGKIDNVTGAAGMDLRFNGSSTGYGGEELIAITTAVTSGQNPDGTGAIRFATSYNTANIFSSFVIFIPWHSKNPTGARSMLSLAYAHDGTNNNLRVYSGTWTNNSPVQRIELFTAGGANVKAGSAATLYGIR